ncbi:Aste57867_13491 [Aphanomyces stellatus]|uniref:Aste57867_13491 protein n=1 Tax=Aphanomyces stellatus TaxID=120398 RepID=A0A485KZ01_9STRA|nr:hypothetical protein As57867_013441 [Aphanomyces stellatus]VFT90329.1 Aste57867_13491 [Aphanomyces stellatus]
MMNCGVCKENPRKYKCPLCRLPYCSAACFKVHKETPCSAPKVDAAPLPPSAPTTAPRPITEPEEDEIPLLTKEQLAVLSTSEKLKKVLLDPLVRSKITEIDQHPDRLLELQKALTDPAFARVVYSMMDEVYSVGN